MSNRRAGNVLVTAIGLLAGTLMPAGASIAAGSPELEIPRLFPEGEYTVRDLQRAMPTIGAPEGVEMEVVAADMTNNGLPMQIHQLMSARPLEEVVALYKERFEQLGIFGPQSDVDLQRGFATIVGGLGPYFVRMQIAEQDRKTTGYLSIMAQPGTVETDRESEFPLPASVTVESRMEFQDDEGDTKTLMAHSNDFPGTVLDDLQRTLTAEGWEQVDTGAAQNSREKGVLRFIKGGDRVEILVSGGRDGPYRSGVIVNWSKR